MKSLNHGFREFFAVDSMFFSEREMNSDLAFIEVDIREGSSGCDRSIESHSELSYHYFSFILDNPVIELRKRSREVITREHSPILYNELKWGTMIYRKVLSWIGFYETSAIQRIEFDRFSKYLTNRKCTSFVDCLSIVSGVTANLLKSSKSKNITVHRLYSRISSISIVFFDQSTHHSFLSQIFICLIGEGRSKCIEFIFLNIGKMIEFDNMDTEMEEFESDTKSGQSEIGRLHEYNDRSRGK